MKIIGITGGIGTGKSTVAQLLRNRGWTVYSSDDTAKDIMESDVTVREFLVATFGAEAILSNGSVNRSLVSSMVFGDTPDHHTRLDALNRLVHPRVLDAHMRSLERHRADSLPLVAIESALLYEVGLEDGFDYVIVVDADEDVRIQRTMDRTNATRQAVIDRMAQQMPTKDKRSWADVVVENNGSHEDLLRAVSMAALVIEALPDPDEIS